MPRHLWVEHEAEHWQRVRKQEREKQKKENEGKKEKLASSRLLHTSHSSTSPKSGETIRKQILQNNASQVTATPGKRSHF